VTERSTAYHAHALTRGLELLRVIARSTPPCRSLSELNEGTGLPKSTLVRLLSVLEAGGFVRRSEDSSTYHLGHGVLELAEGYLRSNDASVIARPHLRRLSDATGQTANLGVIDGSEVVHVCVQEPDRPLRFRSVTGSTDALHCTGLGKMLLAGLADDVIATVLPAEPFEQRTANTLVTADAVIADVRRCRERRFSLDDEEGAEGVRCVSVPLCPDADAGDWMAAISVSGPAGEIDPTGDPELLVVLHDVAASMVADVELMTSLSVLGRRPANV